jgi:hypothetical protein
LRGSQYTQCTVQTVNDILGSPYKSMQVVIFIDF